MSVVKNALRPLWNRALKQAARAYVSGEPIEDALRISRRWSSRGTPTTIGYWNSAGEDPDAVARANTDCVDVLQRHLPDGYLSLKLGAMDYRRALLVPILERAKAGRLRVHFDSLGPETTARTNEEIGRARAIHSDLGCTLPGRWRRSVTDAAWAEENNLCVRVVKGQWADPDAPDYDPREGFEKVVERLAGRVEHVAVATHDVPLADACIKHLRNTGTQCEWELLHGLPMREALGMARHRRVPVRLYVPYGASFLPYSIDYVRKNPHVFMWLLRDLMRGQRIKS